MRRSTVKKRLHREGGGLQENKNLKEIPSPTADVNPFTYC